MPTYDVHVYREKRLLFLGIEAASQEQAAAVARDKEPGQADHIDDECDGEYLGALVDVVGDTEYEQSRFIDCPDVLVQRAAPQLLAACRLVVERWEKGDLAEAARTCAAAIAAAAPPCKLTFVGELKAEHLEAVEVDGGFVMRPNAAGLAIIEEGRRKAGIVEAEATEPGGTA